MKPQDNRKTDSNPQTKISSKMNTYLPSIEGRATSVLASLQEQQESYPMGILTDAIQVIQQLRGIAKKQNTLRHTIQQLEGQLRIKDMQIAELKKQSTPKLNHCELKTMNDTTNANEQLDSIALFGTWLPFDTIPHSTSCDRDSVLLCGLNGMVTAYWDGYGWVPDGVECTYDMAECRLDIGKPTHWMQLPSLPNKAIDK